MHRSWLDAADKLLCRIDGLTAGDELVPAAVTADAGETDRAVHGCDAEAMGLSGGPADCRPGDLLAGPPGGLDRFGTPREDAEQTVAGELDNVALGVHDRVNGRRENFVQIAADQLSAIGPCLGGQRLGEAGEVREICQQDDSCHARDRPVVRRLRQQARGHECAGDVAEVHAADSIAARAARNPETTADSRLGLNPVRT